MSLSPFTVIGVPACTVFQDYALKIEVPLTEPAGMNLFAFGEDICGKDESAICTCHSSFHKYPTGVRGCETPGRSGRESGRKS